MFRILWVYFQAFFYILCHLTTIRKHSKYPERYSNWERFQHVKAVALRVVRWSGCPVEVIGKEHLLDEPVLFVANHASMIDPYFLSAAINYPTGAVIAGDEGYEKIPIISSWLQATGSIYVDRENPRRALEGIHQGIKNIQEGWSLILFPEGEITRYVDPTAKVAPFQTGGLKIAIKAKVPIVPIAISGTHRVYKRRSIIGPLRKNPVKITILPPYTKHLDAGVTAKDMAEELREIVMAHVDHEVHH